MIPFLSPTLRDAISAAAGAALAFAALTAFDRLVDDPAVRRDALRGYVVRVELEAANARAAEAERQRAAADDALAEFAERIRRAEAAAAEARDALEQAIADYEARAGADACRLTDDDIEFLTR